MNRVETKSFGGDIANLDRVAEHLTISERNEDRVSNLRFRGWKISVDGVGSA
jgi:hypothetical protein